MEIFVIPARLLPLVLQFFDMESFRPMLTHTYSIGFVSGDMAGHKINCLFKSRFYIYMRSSIVIHVEWPANERMAVKLRNHDILNTESRSLNLSIQITIENVKV